MTPPLELETKRSRRNLRSGLVALVVVIVVAAIGILVTVAHHAPPSSKAQPHLLGRLSKEPTGQISGVFERVGGPALPAKNGGTTTLRVPLNGMVEVHEGSRRGRIVAQARTVHGRFTVTVPAGRYVLNGSSPDGFNCPTFKARQVAEGQTVQLNVICPVP